MKKQIILLFLTFSTANCYALSVQEFISKCSSAHISKPNESPQQTVNRALDAGSCSGYVGGVLNGVNLVGNLLIRQKVIPNNFICIPGNKQANELLTESITYMKGQNNIQKAPAQLGVYNALATAYPCTPKSPVKNR